MGHMALAYNNVRNGRRCFHGNRGFRLNPKRFSLQRFRARFVYLFKLLNSWRSSYGQALKSLKKGLGRRNSININNSGVGSNITMSLVSKVPNMGRTDCRLRSFRRSNSFYAEAIADCLEFIKRSSVSEDRNPIIQR